MLTLKKIAGASMAMLVAFSCCSMTYAKATETDYGLDVDEANEAFEKMKKSFKREQRSYGDIPIFNGDSIYKEYQTGITESIKKMDIEGKIKKFKEHEFEGYGTIEEMDDFMSDFADEKREEFKDSFNKEQESAEDFLERFAKQQDKVSDMQEETGKLYSTAKGNRDKYMKYLENYKQANTASNGGLGGMSFDELGCYSKGQSGINTTTTQDSLLGMMEKIEQIKQDSGWLVIGDPITETFQGIMGLLGPNGVTGAKKYNQSAQTVLDKCGGKTNQTGNAIGNENQSINQSLTSNKGVSANLSGVIGATNPKYDAIQKVEEFSSKYMNKTT